VDRSEPTPRPARPVQPRRGGPGGRPERPDGPESLRGLGGAGPSQVGVSGAMRARDVSRPRADDQPEGEPAVDKAAGAHDTGSDPVSS
jgi:hypothetical protein